MSRRALRRLRGEQRGQEGPGLGELGLDPGPERAREGGPPPAPGKGPRGPPRAGVSNRFELIPAEESEDEPVAGEERPETRLSEQDMAGGSKDRSKEGAVTEETDGDGQREGQEAEQPDQMLATSNKPRKKKKKRKTKKNSAGETLEDNDLEDIDSLLERIEDPRLAPQSQGGITADTRPLLYVEHRNLNPENELKRYFGARAVLGDQRPRQRQRQYVRSMWLTAPKNTWPRYSKTGITMQLLDTRRGVQHFTFEHHREYQQVQFKFLDAVESMDPNNIVLLLQMNPYHVDSLLQLSDVCRMQEDQEMARDLIERALYSLECAFHPVFSLTSGTCRLDYRRPENRAFFLALFKHLMFLEKRGCPRTALEFCKLILSLDPENDPLCVLLLIDFLSLRAREYTFLTRLFQEWESHRNLSQLPNFAFSVPLAYFFLSQQEERPELERGQARERAAQLIQLALIMFPSVLMPLLDHCSVQPDARVASHPFFGLNAQISQSPALNQLTSLYVGRTHALWKDPAVMAWLEPHVHEVLHMVEAQDTLVQEAEHKRKIRYQSAPRNIYRHIILSEMKEATAALPLEVTSQPVMGFDPLPPLDSIVSYTRPERAGSSSTMVLPALPHPIEESQTELYLHHGATCVFQDKPSLQRKHFIPLLPLAAAKL
ncbi:transcription factor 25 isoform X2 [Parus major]|uniref:transcription factor 25 isoform X2 n=1 Tax=Parus major TaxID=9157 RepID=UPI00144483ED|nr:transcription factor 25 isoform X2 [Parus major]